MNARRFDAPPRLNLTLLLAAAAALGAALTLARQVPYGVGLHWDSVIYVTVARNLLAGAGLRDYTGFTYVGWPPLYPLLLAVVSGDVLDPFHVAGPVNAALFGLTIFVVGQYLRRRLESRFLVVWAALTIALAQPLAWLVAYAFTETAFILLITLTLIHTEAFLAKGKTSSLVWAGVWAALAWQTRYVGGALPAAVAVMLLLQRGARPAQRVRRVAGFALLAGAPMAAWLARNRVAVGTFTGPPDPTGEDLSLPEVVIDIGRVLLEAWTTFDLPLVEWQSIARLGFLPAAALAAACVVLIRDRRRRRAPSDRLPCYVFGGFALVYLTVLAIILSLIPIPGAEARYVAPLYIPVLVTAAFALDRLLGFAPGRRRFWRRWKPRWRRRAPRAAAAAAAAVLCFWTAGQIEPYVREIRHANSEGLAGYSHSDLAETQEWISRNPLTGLIVSNSTIAASLTNDALDAEYGYLPGEKEHLAEYLERTRAYGVTFYVVWFDNVWVNTYFDYNRAALNALPHLEPVAELADGAVFKPASPPDTE